MCKIRKLTIIVALLFFVEACGFDDINNDTSVQIDSSNNYPIPPESRPRVLVNLNTISKLKTRFESNEMAMVREKILLQAEAINEVIDIKGKVSRATYRSIEANALLYLLNKDKVAGYKAIKLIADTLPILNPENKAWFNERLNHRIIYTAAMVYDWCYDIMSADVRALIINESKRLFKSSEYSWPMDGSDGHRITYLTNHFGEEKIPVALALGIATYNESPDIYQHVAEHLYQGFVPSRNWFYPSHRHHQGSAYGNGRFESEVQSTFIMTQMGATRPYIDEQGKVPYHAIYNRRPDDILMHEGDDFNPEAQKYGMGSGNFGIHGQMMAATEFQDPYIKDYAQRYMKFTERFKPFDEPVLHLLYQDETLQAKSVETLPLTKFFNEPLASMTARTGWDLHQGVQSNVAIATMNMSNYYFGNHDHLDAGHFSIYYKGALAIDSGAYTKNEGGHKHGGDAPHWNNYYRRSIAHNTILVRDPDEPYRPGSVWDGQNEGGQVVNSGGPIEQYNAGAPINFEELLKDGKQVELLGHGFGPDKIEPDYSYLKGDMAKAYHFNYLKVKPKVEQAVRAFTFLNLKNDNVPAALIVFDKVTARKADFKKRWLLHSIDEPNVNSDITTVVRTATFNDYSGKMVNQTILPKADNLSITKIGGKGKGYWVESANKNYALIEEEAIERFEAGRWRIEVSPLQQNKTDLFFNVIQVMDNNKEPLPTHTIETDSHIGVQLADRTVVFAKSGENYPQDFNFRIQPRLSKILLTDLAEGSWQINGEIYQVEDGSSSIYYESDQELQTVVKF